MERRVLIRRWMTEGKNFKALLIIVPGIAKYHCGWAMQSPARQDPLERTEQHDHTFPLNSLGPIISYGNLVLARSWVLSVAAIVIHIHILATFRYRNLYNSPNANSEHILLPCTRQLFLSCDHTFGLSWQKTSKFPACVVFFFYYFAADKQNSLSLLTGGCGI